MVKPIMPWPLPKQNKKQRPLILTAQDINGEIKRVFEKDIIKIGKYNTADLKLEDPSVSSMHAIIERNKDKIYLVDLGSQDGTWVNGERIVFSTAVKEGDIILFGDVPAKLSYEERVKDLSPDINLQELIYRTQASVNIDYPMDYKSFARATSTFELEANTKGVWKWILFIIIILAGFAFMTWLYFGHQASENTIETKEKIITEPIDPWSEKSDW